jgi:hypothetical protein
MNKDLRKKERPDFNVPSTFVQTRMLKLLKLSDELEVIYQTYPKLRRVVGHEAWQELSDRIYQDLLKLNLNPDRFELRMQIDEALADLEDLSVSTLVRDKGGLKDTAARVLRVRLKNGLILMRKPGGTA